MSFALRLRHALPLALALLVYALPSSASAHTVNVCWLIHANGDITFYAATYHDPSSGLSGGIVVDGTTYAFTQSFGGDINGVGVTSCQGGLQMDGTVNPDPCGAGPSNAPRHWQEVRIPASAGITSGDRTITISANSQIETPWPGCYPTVETLNFTDPCAMFGGDTDGDFICDANDGCPLDPNKGPPGDCGCGVPDVDLNMNMISDCLEDVCNDGMVTGAETCEDGNTTPGDGCSATCQVEPGWTCSGLPAMCMFTCGDGVIDAHETCDDGNTNDGDGCSATCSVEAGFGCVPSLFATGVNDNGDALPQGGVDPHWTWSQTNDESTGVPAIAAQNMAWPDHPPGRWVSASAMFGEELTTGANTYWFQRVEMPAGFAGTLTFPIVVSCDNSCEVFVNGVSFGGHNTFTTAASITIPASAFVAGSNLVTVRLQEDGPGTPRGILIYPGGGGILSQCTELCMNDTDCDDGNECTTDTCLLNACTNSAVAAATSCATGVCNGDSLAPACVECVTGAQCGDGNDCTQDLCMGNSCTNPNEMDGTACGDSTATECTAADTCLSGTCNANDAMAGTACGTQGVECFANDTCDGAGACTDNGFAAAGTACGDSGDTECTNPDTCDGAGTCDANHETAGSACGDQGVECLVDDACDGAGACTDNGFESAGTACGDSSDTECTNPDSCDGAGSCDANHEAAGAACGDQGVDCSVDDACDGSGACTDNGFEAAGTACGDSSDTDCTNPDSCDDSGSCLANHESDGTSCTGAAFCTTGDMCLSGSCAEGSDPACDPMTDKCDEDVDMCVLACGDGVLDVSYGEECDNGMSNSDSLADACRTSCLDPSCGDGVVDSGETCDNGAANSDTDPGACRLSCVPASCGDGVVDPGEGCDEGRDNSDLPGATCRTDCAPAGCGDGVLDTASGEICDEGAANADTPDALCRTTCVLPSCGDGITDTLAGEACDDGGLNSDVNADACRTTCAAPTCGDGVTDTGEGCDNADANSDSTADACRTSCEVAGCGDGVMDTGEACDDGAANSDATADACRTTCEVASCGDGVMDTGEACDDGAANSDIAADACRLDCSAATCGDGVVDMGEDCDDGVAGSATCTPSCMTIVINPDMGVASTGELGGLSGGALCATGGAPAGGAGGPAVWLLGLVGLALLRRRRR